MDQRTNGGANVVPGVCFEWGEKEKKKASAVGLGFLERSALDELEIFTPLEQRKLNSHNRAPPFIGCSTAISIQKVSCWKHGIRIAFSPVIILTIFHFFDLVFSCRCILAERIYISTRPRHYAHIDGIGA